MSRLRFGVTKWTERCWGVCRINTTDYFESMILRKTSLPRLTKTTECLLHEPSATKKQLCVLSYLLFFDGIITTQSIFRIIFLFLQYDDCYYPTKIQLCTTVQI